MRAQFLRTGLATGGLLVLGCADSTAPPATMTALSPSAVGAAEYAIVDLGTLGGDALAFGISDAGHVVGVSYTSTGNFHGFMWQGGVMTDIGDLGGGSSFAWDVNDAGQVVGWSTDASGQTHAILWQAGTMIDLGTLPGGFASEAHDINDAGEIVGYSYDAVEQRAVAWRDRVIYDLGSGRAEAINDAGQVVGSRGSAAAILWNDGAATDLGNLGVAFAVASGINNAGQVVGSSYTSGGQRAFVWEGGTLTDLGTLPGDVLSFAWKINDAGVIVGASAAYDAGAYSYRPSVWQDGAMFALSTLGGTFNIARDINANGQIVGTASTSAGANRAVLWTAQVAPEQQVQNLSAEIASLAASGSLEPGVAHSLERKLAKAAAALGTGDSRKAIQQLRAFISQVASLVGEGTLDEYAGQSLIGVAQAIVSQLSSTGLTHEYVSGMWTSVQSLTSVGQLRAAAAQGLTYQP